MAVSTAAAIIAATAASAYGANRSAGAVRSASRSASRAAESNDTLFRDIYDENKNVLTPYINSGVENMGRINALLGSNPYHYNPGTFEEDPGYKFRLSQGLEAVNQNRATRGLLKSGSALKALNDYAQGQASQEYGNWFNRDQARIAGENNVTSQYINALQGQQNSGMAAGSALAGVGQNYASNAASNNNALANTQGNAALAGANQTNNLIGQGVNALAYFGGQGGFGQRGSSYGGGTPTISGPLDPLSVAGAYR